MRWPRQDKPELIQYKPGRWKLRARSRLTARMYAFRVPQSVDGLAIVLRMCNEEKKRQWRLKI